MKQTVCDYLNAILQIRDNPKQMKTSDIKHLSDYKSWIQAITNRGVFTINKQAIRNTLYTTL